MYVHNNGEFRVKKSLNQKERGLGLLERGLGEWIDIFATLMNGPLRFIRRTDKYIRKYDITGTSPTVGVFCPKFLRHTRDV
jgi:hypothetical protein